MSKLKLFQNGPRKIETCFSHLKTLSGTCVAYLEGIAGILVPGAKYQLPMKMGAADSLIVAPYW